MIVLLGAWFVPACATAATPLPAVPGQQPLLGQGYDSRSGRLREICVVGDVRYAGTQEASLDVDVARSHDELVADVEATIKAGISAIVVAAEAQSELSNFFATTGLRSRYFASAYVRGKSALLSSPRLTALGEKAFSTRDEDTIRNICGDSYIAEVGLGVSFVFSLSMRHAESHSATRVKTTYKVELPLKTLKKTKTKSWTVDTAATSVSFDAVQFGGARDRFEAFRAGLDRMRCERQPLTQCFERAEEALDYVTGANGLVSQIAGLTYDPAKGSSNPILHGTPREYGAWVPAVTLPPPNRVAEPPEGIAEKEGRALELLGRARSYLADPRTPDESRRAMEMAQSNLAFNLALFRRARTSCRGSDSNCAEEWERLEGAALPVDERDLVRPLRFVDYCLGRDAEAPWEPTIAAVLHAMGTDDCDAAGARLEAARRVSLRGRNLGDVSPLSWLPAAEELDLAHNAVPDLPGEISWPRARSVNVAHNRLSRIGPLLRLPALVELNAAYNSLTTSEGGGGPRTRLLHGNIMAPPPVSLPDVTFTEKQACDRELRRLVEAGLLSSDLALFYSTEGFGPEFEWDEGTRRHTGGFADCPPMATTFD